MKKTLVVGGAMLLAGFGFYLHDISKMTEAAPIVSGDVIWVIEAAGEDPESAAPLSSVAIKRGAKTYELGTYAGSCFEIDNVSWKLYEGELTGVICWFAGGGEELGVFGEGSWLVVKRGQLDEGSAETPGVRGNFKQILVLGE
ncbi:MAG: hypothetical protein G01um10148_528 [Parcubacteria group bacterium Gr01-1014_8]|nr:MAG: hypothetical protein G01um10148_528 [Parcubacteria group bacterium Gr01-1014_8]